MLYLKKIGIIFCKKYAKYESLNALKFVIYKINAL